MGSLPRKYSILGRALLFLILCTGVVMADPRCAGCHPKEDAAYAKTGMARSVVFLNGAALPPDGSFDHEFSKTKFVIHSSGSVMTQSLSRSDETAEQKPAFAIGSGAHIFEYLTQVNDHVFQSPLAYYTAKKAWNVAPAYENDHYPDFSRPIGAECLFCHSGKPLPIANTVNRYQSGVFAATGISCERCHGDVSNHLSAPTAGSIRNPAKMVKAARASVCEQCHLTGEVRIANPGKAITDFKPGFASEDLYTTYAAANSSGAKFRPGSETEQLALSKCALASGDRMWCGTCHNPHNEPANATAYYRERCLSCHAATLRPAHIAAGQDCVGCHMPKLDVRDGGHMAFTDHRILRAADPGADAAKPDSIGAWREPDVYVKDRNLALALVTVGLQHQSTKDALRGYKMLRVAVNGFPSDNDVVASLGVVLLKANEPADAAQFFRKAISLLPNYPPYYMDLATALYEMKQPSEALEQAEKARALDPLFQPPIRLMRRIYRSEGKTEKSDALLLEYDKAMGSLHR